MAQNRKTKKNKSNAKSWKSMFAFFRDMDPELKSILVKCAGGLVLLIALFTFVSMFSYVFTWSVDMDLLMNAERLSRDVDVSNIGGKLGYLWSHFLISDMLGLASFIFVFLFAALAYRLFFGRRCGFLFFSFLCRRFGCILYFFRSIVVLFFFKFCTFQVVNIRKIIFIYCRL